MNIFIKEVKKLINCEIGILTESRGDITDFSKETLFDFFNVINQNIKFNKAIDQETVKIISKKYSKYLLKKLNLTLGGRNQFINSSINDEYLRCIYIQYFEKCFKNLEIDCVLLSILNSTNNNLVPIIDAVCKFLRIKVLFVDKPGVRILISDSINGSSSLLDQIYKRKLIDGISHDDKIKTKNAINAYVDFKKSPMWDDFVFKKNKLVKRKKKSRKIKNIRDCFLLAMVPLVYLKKRLNRVEYDKFDYKNKKFVIFLPNKFANYRTNYHSPLYSNFSNVVRNIYLSLPSSHSLIVKDHPHSVGGEYNRDIIEECNKLDNVYYIDPLIETFELMRYADIVFTVASITGFEALFLNKHVVTFGETPYFFGNNETPINKMKNWEDLQDIIYQCLNVKPNKKNIIKYIFSFYSVTTHLLRSFDNDEWTDYDIWNPPKPTDMYKNAGYFLGTYLNSISMGSIE